MLWIIIICGSLVPSSKQLEAIRTIPKFSYKSQTIMRNSMENGFESTNLMLPRKENKNMLRSVQIFITNFEFNYFARLFKITVLYFA